MRSPLFLLLLIMSQLTATADSIPVFFGTGSNPLSKGIYATTFDTAKGTWASKVSLVAELSGPGWLTKHPELPILYSSGAVPGTKDFRVTSFQLGMAEGRPSLTELNAAPSPTGSVTHIAVDPSGKLLVTAQYGAGTVSVFPLRPDGTVGPQSQVFNHGDGTRVDPSRQDKAHPHYATFDPSGHYVLVPDLGADTLFVYKADVDAARLTLHQKVPSTTGAGPRHMKFSPDGRLAYVLNELSLTVASYTWDAASGTLSFLSEVPTLPAEMKDKELENTASEIQVHPNGRFVYAGNRGNDSITVFQAEPTTGDLSRIQIEPARVAWPRNFNLDPTARWIICAGQDSSTAGIFAVDQHTGKLTYQPHTSIIVPAAICVLFVEVP